MKITFVGTHGDAINTKYPPQDIVIDGENMVFDKYTVYECMPRNIDFIMNPAKYRETYRSLNRGVEPSSSCTCDCHAKKQASLREASTQTDAATQDA